MTDMITNPENVTASAESGDAITASALKSYRRPWSVSIDDENCRAVIRDADGLEVAYISDVIRSRAGETAQMFVGLVEERDRLRENIASMLGAVYAERQKADMFKRQWEKATGSEFAKKLSAARSECDRLRNLVRRMAKLLLRHTGDDGEGEYSDSYPIYEEARKALGEDKP